MKLATLMLTVALMGFPGFVAQSAQETHDHSHSHAGSETLGTVDFNISCKPSAQKEFNRAVALLHSFWYPEAEKAFQRVAELNSKCAMAHWGIAMTLYHPLWERPNPDELKKGWTAVEKAQALGGKDQREQAYIAAIGEFYKNFETRDHATRAVAYEKAMERVHRDFPQDREAAVFYGLALLSTAPPTDKTYGNQKKAGEILNRLLPDQPQHPGIAHYIIHSFDYPELAELAVPAARAYAKIASASPHAHHMPSHIFTRLGMWPESISSNLTSAKVARDWIATVNPGASTYEELHAMDYLTYAYLQQGQDKKARELFEQLANIKRLDANVFQAGYAFAAIPARYALERRSWSEAAHLELAPTWFPWDKFPYAAASVHFARGLGAARTRNLDQARREVETLEVMTKQMLAAGNKYWADQIEINRVSVSAWIALAEGKSEEALRQMQSAAELENRTEKHPVTPGAVIPANELLGEMLLEMRKPAEAARSFENTLRKSPRRFNALYGAARAAEMQGDRVLAGRHYQELARLAENADSERKELQYARSFSAEAKVE